MDQNVNHLENGDLGRVVGDWLMNVGGSLEYVFSSPPPPLSVVEALSGPAKEKACDPYGSASEPPLKNKIIQTEDVTRPEKLYGNHCVRLTTGEELTAFWRGGKREGPGSLLSPRLEQLGISRLTGFYVDGELTGQGKLIMADGSTREGWFSLGYFHGPVSGRSPDGGVNWIGRYRAGIPAGSCWQAVRGGGWLVGALDTRGKFTGDGIAFLYPDLCTALVGEFCDGQLVSGRPASVTGYTLVSSDSDSSTGDSNNSHNNGNDVAAESRRRMLIPSFTFTSTNEFTRCVSTREDITCPPLLPDPYESVVVQVGCSGLQNAGEGLYAKEDIPCGRIVCYYNGLRMRGEGSLCPEETGYAIFVDVNRLKDKNAEHMDVPAKYQSAGSYCASLAHKLNHSFTPNCIWDNAEHPVFGFVPAVRTLENIKKGAELTIHYRMDMEGAPEWYLNSWDLHSCSGARRDHASQKQNGGQEENVVFVEIAGRSICV